MSIEVEQYAVFEHAFRAVASSSNPYRSLSAVATFSRPDGRESTIPLFWDGGTNWRVRLSPDQVGDWSFRIDSTDAGLNGQRGAFRCVASLRRGGIVSMTDFPHHFQYQDGTPCWLFGETAWMAFGHNPKKALSRETLLRFVDRRATQGFNYMHLMVMSSGGDGDLDWSGAGENEGGPIFEDFADETLNPAYFQEADVRVAHMNDRGITVGLVYGWGYGWPRWDTLPNDEARLRFARYLVARYSAFNVVHIIAGEWNPWFNTEHYDRYDTIGREVMRCDPHQRMRGIHPWPDPRTFYADADWNSFADYQQTFHQLHARALAPRSIGRPVVNSEYGYHLRDADGDGIPDKDNSHTLEEIRHATWDIVMAGAYFVTGFGSTYYGGWRDPGLFDPEAEKNLDWEDDVQHVHRFFTSLQWWKLEPADDVVLGPGICWCLAEAGQTYIVYARECPGTIHVAVANEEEHSRYRVQRFDPRTGAFDELPEFSATEIARVRPPDRQDWVFLLTRQ